MTAEERQAHPLLLKDGQMFLNSNRERKNALPWESKTSSMSLQKK